MGPKSKDAVVRALGRIVDELQQQRILLQRMEGKLDKRDTEHSDDLQRLGQRVTTLEGKIVRGGYGGAAPAPAE